MPCSAGRRRPHRLAVLAVLAGLFAALGGCALAPPQPTAGIAAPAAWSDDAGLASGSLLGPAWWSRFDDALLTALVTQALQSNTSIESASAALRQARALRDVAAAGLLPAVGGSASAGRGTVGGQDTGSSFKLGLDASWELDLFGANRSALAATEATLRAGAASLGDVQVSIAAEVALGFIGLRGAQEGLAIASDNLASQQETLQITQWRQQAGLITALESEQARAAAEQTAAQMPALQTRITQAQHALAVLTGQAPAALADLLRAPGPMPQAPDGLALSLPADTLRQRADVRAAEAQVAAAAARVTQADAARLPNFSLGGSLGLNALTIAGLGNGSAVITSLLAGVTMPLFDGGAARAQVRAQQAALDQAQASYRATVLTALQDVEDALIALRGDRQRLRRLQRAADAAGNAALLARQRYSSGLIDFQTVLDTQRTQLTTQENVVVGKADLASDQVRLYKALGGGWRADSASAALPEPLAAAPAASAVPASRIATP
jgi:NodT family efflux transporter outer membrane factor (OMF) lipoprotein